MRLRDALQASSAMDIIYSCNDRGATDDVKRKNPLGMASNKRNYPPVDRSQQGAALSGFPNAPHERTKKVVDSTPHTVISSTPLAPIVVPPAAPQAPKKEKVMQLTLKGLNAKRTTAIYSGTLGSVRIGLAAFPGKSAPESIEVADGVFAVKTPKAPKVKLTKEERAALPKPTEAERIAKMEERLAKAKAKLAEANSDI